MNLNELKYIWQAHSSAQATQEQHSHEAIRQMLYQRSRTALSRINRNILLEAAFMLLTLLGSIWMLWQQPANLDAMWLFLILFSVGSLIFYRVKYQQLNRATLGRENLRTSLWEIARVMGHYMHLYTFMAVVIPVLACLSLLYGYGVAAAEDGRSLMDLALAEWGILLGIMAIYGVFSYFGVRWYVRRLYGRHHQELKNCLAELDEAALPL
jgi:cation transport ATPase